MQYRFTRECLEEAQEPLHLFVKAGVLLIHVDDILPFAPQSIHRVQLRATLGQPQQLDVEQAGQGHRAGGGVTGILLQQQRHMPTTVVSVQQLQKRLKVRSPLMRGCSRSYVTRR